MRLNTAELSKVVRKLREAEISLVDIHRDVAANIANKSTADAIEAAALKIDFAAGALNDLIRFSFEKGVENDS
jgi:hypothetical protein